MAADVLTLRRKEFLLWRPARTEPPPSLVIGRLQSGAPVTFVGERSVELTESPHGADLWSVALRSLRANTVSGRKPSAYPGR